MTLRRKKAETHQHKEVDQKVGDPSPFPLALTDYQRTRLKAFGKAFGAHVQELQAKKRMH